MKKINNILVLVTLSFLLTSCYSVRLRSIEGEMQPDPLKLRDDYYRGKEAVDINTVVKIDITSKDFTYLIKKNDKCKSGKLHTVEFRNTFGGSLLSLVTFGRKRKMKVTYVCMKPTN